MYAVIKTGGKQYKVASGDVVKLEKIAGEEGKEGSKAKGSLHRAGQGQDVLPRVRRASDL